MKAHDVAISRLRELAAEKRPLTEAEIRTWNAIILKEPFWAGALTPDGQPTRKRIVPGEYKSSPNSVRTATGEIFEFAAPQDVTAMMGELVSRLNAISAAPLAEWPELLARTHHEFVRIHPFDDGNGRVTRLITNYLLLSGGLVPVVVPSAGKKTYFMALQQADVGLFDALTGYLGGLMINALEEALTIANGA